MIIEIGAAKISQYDSVDSEETTEILERPSGGQSIVYCRGQYKGSRSKTVSSVIVNKILEKTAEGARDSIAVKNVSDQLYREHSGEILGDVCMISADFESGTIVVSRCTPCPVYCYTRGELNEWAAPAEQLASAKGLHPSITEIPLQSGTVIFMLSEGILNAGSGIHTDDELDDFILSMAEDAGELAADEMADMILKHAIRMDQNHPKDDMTAVILKVSETSSTCRRLRLTSPVPGPDFIFD